VQLQQCVDTRRGCVATVGMACSDSVATGMIGRGQKNAARAAAAGAGAEVERGANAAGAKSDAGAAGAGAGDVVRGAAAADHHQQHCVGAAGTGAFE
jgi:hypothetical protein